MELALVLLAESNDTDSRGPWPDRGSGRQRRRARLEREPEAPARRGVVGGAVADDGKRQRRGEYAAHAREGPFDVVLDVVQPAREAPGERQADGEQREDGQRVAVQPGVERGPTFCV